MNLIYFILCAYSLTQILVSGKIFDKIRPDKKFFKCPMCIGFWVGIFLVSINSFTELFSFNYTIINFLLLGWLSSGTSYILYNLFGDSGLQIKN